MGGLSRICAAKQTMLALKHPDVHLHYQLISADLSLLLYFFYTPGYEEERMPGSQYNLLSCVLNLEEERQQRKWWEDRSEGLQEREKRKVKQTYPKPDTMRQKRNILQPWTKEERKAKKPLTDMDISRHCLRPTLSERPPQKKAPNIIPRYTMLPGGGETGGKTVVDRERKRESYK